MKPFSKLSKEERQLLYEAWTWLEEHGYPFDVTDDSAYKFLYVDSEGGTTYPFKDFAEPCAVIEVRNYSTPWIQLLFVREKHRRSGKGQLLLDQVVQMARANGQQLGLGTRTTNVAMMALAQKAGFVQSEQVIFHKSP